MSQEPELNTIWDEARGYIERGENDRAIEIYRYILLRYADDIDAFKRANYQLSDLYISLRKLDLAEIYIKKALAFDHGRAEYHHLLGSIHSLRNEWGTAVREFQKALSKEPDNVEYLRGLGWATFNMGYRVKGLEGLHKANDLAPSNINVLNDLAAAYLTMTCFEMAREQVHRALLIDPSNVLSQQIKAKIKEFEQKFGSS